MGAEYKDTRINMTVHQKIIGYKDASKIKGKTEGGYDVSISVYKKG